MAGVNYLLDSNILLELLLNQEKADVVETFLASTSAQQLSISDFSLHSLGVILFRQRKSALFLHVVDDLLTSGLSVLALSKGDYARLRGVADKFSLDFDDAYQYTVAMKYGLRLVSFDGDFARTGIPYGLQELL